MTDVFGAVDIGGTKALVGLFDANGKKVASSRFEVGDGPVPEAVTRRLADELRELVEANAATLQGIGVSIPGPLTRGTGVVHLSPNLHWHDYPLGPRLAELAGAPTWIDDDANLAALGEWWRGSGAGVERFVLVIAGSGVGSGIVIGGRLYHGARDSAGEIGHIPVVRVGGLACGCGRFGCLETMASGTSIARRGRELLAAGSGALRPLGEDGPTAEEVFDAAERGDEQARDAIFDAADYLGWGLAVVADVLDPDRIALGGGLGTRGGWYFDAVVDATQRHALAHNVAGLRIERATLGAEAGLYGAALLALRESGLGQI